MNEVAKRILTAIFCIVYTLGINYYNIYTTALYYISLTIVCLAEYHYKIDSTRKKITILLSFIIYVISISYVTNDIDVKYLSIAVPIIMSLFAIELFSGKENPMLSIGTDLIGLAWICLPMLLAIVISYPYGENGLRYHDPRLMYGIMIFVFMGDSGAYFGGRLLGKTKLCPTISPKKTWEGVISGAITSFSSYYIVSEIDILTNREWIVIMIISVIAGIIGDLIESMFKRDLQIKDSGSILPGHGGVLDRIDGLLYTIPFAFSYLVMIGKV
jgi:phosphatidate cytidylyltransferase